MRPTILVTGASGMIGRDLVPYLVANSDAGLMLLMHRHGAGINQGELLRQLYGLPLSPRIRIIRGDVTREDLGLSSEDRSMVTRSVTHFLHGAACTRFDQSWNEARRINTEGTRHVAALATECAHLEQFGYLSTAYVSGRRTGAILEDELHHGEGFVNTYEQSKYAAECYLRTIREVVPVCVYRLSTIFGDSRTGAVWSMTAPHHAMKIMYGGLASMMPGLPDYQVDLIPGDFAAATVGRLFLEHFQPGRTYHVTASADKSCSLTEFIDVVYELFSEQDSEWRQRRYPRPVLSSAAAFDLFTESIIQANNPILAGVLRTVQHFAHQLTYPKSFIRDNVKQVLPAYEDDLPDVRQYAEKVVRYCLQTRWGRHAA